MNKKKIAICLLAALLLTSCGSATTEEKDTTATQDNVGADTTVGETETTEDDLFLITQEDNGGRTFTLLTTETQQYEYDAEEMNGDVVNDAVYGRNMAVEELLGIDFEFIYKPGDWANRKTYCQIIQNSIMAADGAFDIVSGMISCVQPIASTDLFMNVYDIPEIDLNNPWWVSELQDGLTIQGKLIGFIGDMSLSMYKGLSVIYANLDLLEDRGMEDPYALVLNNEWTLDKMIEVASGTGQDLNGDGKYTLGDDVYGMVIYEVAYRSMQASLDIQAVGLDEEGVPTINPLGDKMATAVDKLTAFLKSADVLCENQSTEERSIVNGYFAADKVLYYMTKLESLDDLRDMESDFAILPYPKYDADQSKYLTLIATATQMTYVPTTTNDAALTGKVCEALSYYSYKDVVPAYYDVALKNKYSRDENTQKMLDIIRSGAVMPFEYAYSTVIGGKVWPNMLLCNSSLNEDGNVASVLASMQSVWEGAIEEAMETYGK